MIIVFFLLSAALLLLAVLLLWFVPYLLGQQERRAAQESQHLRNMLSDVLGEQEAVAMRQSHLGTLLMHLQDQLEHLYESWPSTVEQLVAQPAAVSRPLIEQLDRRIAGLQRQLEQWMDDRKGRIRSVSTQENESWAYLMSLLGTMQEQLSDVELLPDSRAVAPGVTGWSGSALIANLHDDLASLNAIADEVSGLQWRLRSALDAGHELDESRTTLALANPASFNPLIERSVHGR